MIGTTGTVRARAAPPSLAARLPAMAAGLAAMAARLAALPAGLAGLAAGLAAMAALAGCGGSTSHPSTSASAGPAPVRASTSQNGPSARAAGVVARVAGRPISVSSYEHWSAVERALGQAANAGARALGFLITSAWLEGEARARGVSVSAGEVSGRLARLERHSFSKPGSLRAYLARAHESEADLLERVRVELLQSRIAAEVAGGAGGARRTAALASFQQGFQSRWRRRTTCERQYVMEDCSEYTGAPSPAPGPAGGAQGASSGSSSQGAGASSPSSPPTQAAAGAGVDAQPGVGGMTIASPALESSAAIPARYGCAGAGVSPPLQWSKIPAKAAALVLFVIDGSSSGPAGGVRWVVGDIDPSTAGVAAGATPQGGIVGEDMQGRSGYGGMCPASGHKSTFELVLYALRKKIPLSSGFEPGLAESEYGAGKDALGQPAITYITYGA